MTMSGNVENNMLTIEKEFMLTERFTTMDKTVEDVIEFLDSRHESFRSVGYEAASMQIALSALNGSDEMERWKDFHTRARPMHTLHLDIGVGWASARIGKVHPHLVETPALSPLMVMDGVGYFHGTYKVRKSLKEQLTPNYVTVRQMDGFDQGIGRRIWYHVRGDIGRAVDIIHSFPTPRQASLWRGLGIACGYVGGLKPDELTLLRKKADSNFRYLGTGVIIAAFSRTISKTVTSDIVRICEIYGIPLPDTNHEITLQMKQLLTSNGSHESELIDLLTKQLYPSMP